jgi:hypothetical protein
MTATVPAPTTDVAVVLDEASFFAADPRRRTSEEAEYGALWRHADASGDEIWRLAYVCDTGELYLARCDPYPGPDTELRLLGVFAAQRDVEAMVAGWQEHCGQAGSLDWLLAQLVGRSAA